MHSGDAIMLIVPAADNLTVEAKVNPQDINPASGRPEGDFALHLVQPAKHAGNRRHGIAHLRRHHGRSAHYYTISIAMSAEQVARRGEVKLVPGMPVEAFIQTGDRTVVSYLVKPIADHFERAFREK